MIYIHDIEVYPNFFSITYIARNSDVSSSLYVFEEHNDLDEIIELFNNKKNWYVGYNSSHYDDRVIAYIIDNKDYLKSLDSELLCFNIYEKSNEFINDKDNKEYKYRVPFKRFDLMKIGNIQKSLKLVAVDLRHDKIQDLPFPIEYKVQPEDVQTILDYNNNDVIITKKLYEFLIDEIKLRQDLSKYYKMDLMNESDSSIANRILEYHYHKATGMWYTDFKNMQTDRDVIHLKDCIPESISFKTKELNDLLDRIKNTVTTQTEKVEFNAIVGNTRYDVLKGGIHSNMPPEIVKEDDTFKLIDADVTSFYPRIMLNGRIKPEHLEDVFLELLEDYVTKRVEAKKNGDKVAANGLKIVINSIFGKLGAKYHWLKDVKAMYQVTLTGQLSLLMLIEDLEQAGIEVFYANTDGITAKVPKDKEELYYEICSKWEKNNNFELEFEEYKECIIRDVNNYLWIPKNGSPKYKGFFDIARHEDLRKSFDKPIVAKSIYNFFIDKIPIEETIENHKEIHDFCMAQNSGKDFDIKFNYIENGKLETKVLQRTNRYYVGKKGGHIYKEDVNGKKIGIIVGEPVHILNDVASIDASDYPIKYDYYIREAKKVLSLFQHKQQSLF